MEIFLDAGMIVCYSNGRTCFVENCRFVRLVSRKRRYICFCHQREGGYTMLRRAIHLLIIVAGFCQITMMVGCNEQPVRDARQIGSYSFWSRLFFALWTSTITTTSTVFKNLKTVQCKYVSFYFFCSVLRDCDVRFRNDIL